MNARENCRREVECQRPTGWTACRRCGSDRGEIQKLLLAEVLRSSGPGILAEGGMSKEVIPIQTKYSNATLRIEGISPPQGVHDESAQD
jgi:hypothetical protein